jgi:hypothetical protein
VNISKHVRTRLALLALQEIGERRESWAAPGGRQLKQCDGDRSGVFMN